MSFFSTLNFISYINNLVGKQCMHVCHNAAVCTQWADSQLGCEKHLGWVQNTVIVTTRM